MSKLTWKDRFVEVLTTLCKQTPPDDIVDKWISHESEELQDWVGCSGVPWWLQGIGAIDAAHTAADNPLDGVGDDLVYKRPGPIKLTKKLPTEAGWYFNLHDGDDPESDLMVVRVHFNKVDGRFEVGDYWHCGVEDRGELWAKIDQSMFEVCDEG